MTEPTQRPDRDEQIRQVLAYLEQHRAQYDLVALRKQLLDAGYSNTVVDEAMRRLDGGTTSRPLRGVQLIGCGLAVGNYILIGLLIAAVNSIILPNGYVLLAVPAAVLVAELVVAAATWNSERWRDLSRIALWTVIWTAIIAVILAAMVALLFGICLAIINGQL